MALRQLGLFQLNTNPQGQEIDFGTPANPLDEIFAGSISATTYLGDGSNLEIPGLDSIIAQVSSDKAARVDADASLVTKISTDVQTAVTNLVNGAPSALDTLVEIAAKIGEGSISEANIVAEINKVAVDLTGEASTRLSADNSLVGLVGQVSGGMSTQLSAEIALRGDETLSLTSRISTEEAMRTFQVNSLQNEITGEVNADFNSVDERVSAVESQVVSVDDKLDTEIADRIQAVSSLDNVVTGDVASIDTALAGEIVSRTDADASLALQISSESSSRLQGVGQLESDLSTEVTQRESADNSLELRVQSLEGKEQDNIPSLDERISDVEGDLASVDAKVVAGFQSVDTEFGDKHGVYTQKFTELEGQDVSLTTRVSKEESAREVADSSLNTKIAGEATNRATADTSLNAKIESEVSTLEDTIGRNEQEISQEAAIRAAADTSLFDAFTAKDSELESADAALHTRISNEEVARVGGDSALSNEISVQASMRLSADNSVIGLVNGVKSDLNSEVQSIDVRVSEAENALTESNTSLEERIGDVIANNGSDNSSINDRVAVVEGDIASSDIRVADLESDVQSLDSKLDSEISSEASLRTEAIDAAIDGVLNGAGEAYDTLKELQDALLGNDSDISSILNGQGSIGTRLSTEEVVRASADVSIVGKIESEVISIDTKFAELDSMDLELSTAIEREEGIRAEAESSLETRISTEEVVRANAINSLDAAAYNDTSINTRVSDAEDLIESMVSSEASSRVLGDNSLQAILTKVSDDLASEIGTTNTEVTSLTSRIIAEEGNRVSGDSSLQMVDTSLETRISSEEVARLNGDNALSDRADRMDESVVSLNDRIQAEESTRLAKDGLLDSDIQSINTRVLAEEGKSASLTVRVSNSEDNLTSEVNSLDTRIGNIEASAYDDTSINTRVSDVESTVASQKVEYTGLVDNETNFRKLADEDLSIAIGGVEADLLAEASSRVSADSSLSNKIDSEESSRVSGDLSLGVVTGQVSSDLSVEIDAREYFDQSLTERVSIEEVARTEADASLELKIVGNTNTIANFNELDGASLVGDILTVSGSQQDYTVDLSKYLDNTDNFVTGASLTGDVLTLTRESGASITVNLGQYQTSSEVSSAIIDGLVGYATEDFVNTAVAPLATIAQVNAIDAYLDAKIESVESQVAALPAEENDFLKDANLVGNDLKLIMVDGTTHTVDLSQFMDDTDTDNFVSGASLSGDVLTLSRTNGDITVNLGQYQTSVEVDSAIASAISGKADKSYVDQADASLTTAIAQVQANVDAIPADENDYLTDAELSGNDLVLTMSDGTVHGVDLSQFMDDTDTDNFVSNATLTGDVLTLSRQNGDVTVNLGQYQTSSEVSAQITSAIAGYATESFVAGEVNGEKSARIAADTSIDARLAAMNSDIESHNELSGASFASNVLTISGSEESYTVNLASLATDVNVTSGSYDSAAGRLTLTKSDGNTVAISDFYVDVNGDNFITSATLSGQTLTLGRQGLTDLTVDLSGFVTSGELTSAIANFKSGADITSEIATAVAPKADKTYVDMADAQLAAQISAEVSSRIDSEDFVISAAMSNDTLKLTRAQGGVVSVDLSQFKDDTDTDNFVTGASMSGDKLILSRTNGNVSVDLGMFQTSSEVASQIGSAIAGKADTADVDMADASLAAAISAVQSDFDSLPEDENDYLVTAAMSGNELQLRRTDGGLVTVDLSQFMDDTDTDNFLTGASLSGDILTLSRTNGNVTVNLGQYQTSSEVAAQISTAIDGYATESYVTGAIAPLAVKSEVTAADVSLTTRIAQIESGLSAETSSRVESEDFVVAAEMSNDTLKLRRAQGGIVTVDLGQFKDNTDNFVTGATLAGDTLSLSRVSGSPVTVDLGQYQTSSEVAAQIASGITGKADKSYVDSQDAAILAKIASADTRFGNLPAEDFVNTAEMSNQTLKLTRAQGGVVSVDLGMFTTSGELNTALSPYATSSQVSTQVSSGIASEASSRVAGDGSLNTRVNAISTALGTEITTTNSEVTSLHTRLGQVSSEASTNTNRIGDANASIDDLQSRVGGLEANGYDDTSLETRVSTEESVRESVDGSLHTRVGQVSTALVNEITSTNAEVGSLTTRIANEEGERLSKDNSLNTKLVSEVASIDARFGSVEGDVDSHNELAGTSFTSRILTIGGSKASYSVDLSSLATDVTVTGGTYNSGTQTLSLTKNNGDTISVAGFAIDTDTDNYVDSVSFDKTNGELTIGRTGSLSDLTVDLDGRYLVDAKDTYTTGATFNTGNGVVTFTNNDGGSFTVDLDGRFTDNGYADTMNQHVKTNSAVTFATVNTGQGATEVHLMNQNVRTSDDVTFNLVNSGAFIADDAVVINGVEMRADYGSLTINQDVEINGELRARTKSFLINHPTKPNMKLQYGNLEGPEHGVYVRGKVGADGVIELPEYWTELVDEDSITVQLTAIGAPSTHFVKSIADNKVEVGSESGIVNAFYMINAERKDIYKLKVEFPA